MGGGKSHMGGGGGTSGSGGVNYELIRSLEAEKARLKRELTRLPTIRELRTEMDRLVENGLLEASVRDNWVRLQGRTAIDYDSLDFEDLIISYRYESPENFERISLSRLGNLHEVSFRSKGDMTVKQANATYRDLGAYITASGKYSQTNRDVIDWIDAEIKKEKAKGSR